MGAGDVKLAAGVGGLTGAFGVDVWALAAMAAPLLTAVIALVSLVRRVGNHCAAWSVDVSGDDGRRNARDPLERWRSSA